MSSVRNYIIPNLLTIPMALHWILPWGMEQQLYAGSFFMPDLLIFYYIFKRLTRPNNRHSIGQHRKVALFIVCTAIILYVAILSVLKNINYTFPILIGNLSFVWYTVIYMFFPLNSEQIKYTKPVFIASLLILIGEVILYSSGILVYKTGAGNTLTGQDYNGFMRISTTVGAATGTALCIAIIGAITITLFSWKQWQRWTLIVMSALGIFFTMSRGASLIWVLFVIWLFYRDYYKKAKLSVKIKSLIAFVIFTIVFYSAGAMDPLLDRNSQLLHSSSYTAGRSDKAVYSQRMIEIYAPWGSGPAQILPEKAIEKDYDPPHHFAPHNVYFLIMIELGYPGIILFIALFLLLFSGLDYRRNLSWFLLLVFSIGFNTESVVLDAEFASLILFGVMASSRYIKFSKKITSSNYVKCPIYN